MEEQEELKNKLLKHVFYNIVAFTIIFAIFGIFVFFMVRNMTYKNANMSLIESKNQILQLDEERINFILQPKIFEEYNRNDWIQNAIKRYQEEVLIKKVVNPNVIVIIRNNNKEILNSDDLQRFSEYGAEIAFDEKNLDKIYELVLREKYSYRAINFIYEGSQDGTDDRYVQLLVNVDSEKNLVANYFSIISRMIIVGILLSVIASYVLSIKTLKPLKDNMIKQMEFVQNVSHELRTPLTIIQAKQELLLQEPNQKIIDKSEDIMLTLNETKRLTKLIKDLMLLSRADSNKISLQKESVNIDDFITNLVSPYSEIAELQNKKIELKLNYNMDIEVDTSKIYQLIIILLDNAIKYTEEGDTIEIKTEQKDNKCIIEVADTGIGVSDEGLKRIFERFYRENKDRNRETGGSGLGLSIASYIVTAHNGIIRASHNNPKGTVFTIKLPR